MKLAPATTSSRCAQRSRSGRWLTSRPFTYSTSNAMSDGLDAWAEVVERGYEGLVAKDEASAYESGRTASWR